MTFIEELRQRRVLVFLVAAFFAVLLVLPFIKPNDKSSPYRKYFSDINEWYTTGEGEREKTLERTSSEVISREGKREGYEPFDGESGDGFVFVDLDALDANIKRVNQIISKLDKERKKVDSSSPSVNVRIVCKSLPSIPLLRYISSKLYSLPNGHSTNHQERKQREENNNTKIKLMVFHSSFLFNLIQEFGEEADYLLGLPMTVQAAKYLISRTLSLSPSPFPALLPAIQFLIDTPTRAREYASLGESLSLSLSVSVEIDVGLHRGGVRTKKEYQKVLKIIEESPFLVFRGLMGYDGHCQENPTGMFLGFKSAMKDCIHSISSIYQTYVNIGKEEFPSLFVSPPTPLVFNGAGSTSFPYYNDVPLSYVMNDLSIGSAFIMPGDFDLPSLSPLFSPAIYLAGPVTKILSPSTLSPVPFVLDSLWGFFRWWNPNYHRTLYVTGISMPTCPPVSPPGLETNFLMEGEGSDQGKGERGGGGGGKNIFPTQSLFHHGKKSELELGDLVFCRPKESDAMLGYGKLIGMRPGSRTIQVFETYRGGI